MKYRIVENHSDETKKQFNVEQKHWYGWRVAKHGWELSSVETAERFVESLRKDHVVKEYAQ